MDAIAPAALALSVSLDAVASLGLVLLSYSGPLIKAMLPMTDRPALNIAAGLGDLLLLTLLRGCLVMLPLLGLSATLPWLVVAITIVAAMTGWLAAKAALAEQFASGSILFVEPTGVTIHMPTLIAAEVMGIFMGWFLLILVWVNRRVMMQPAAGQQLALFDAQAAAALQQQRLAVQQWVSQQQPGGAGPDLEVPLLGAAGAGQCSTAERHHEDGEA